MQCENHLQIVGKQYLHFQWLFFLAIWILLYFWADLLPVPLPLNHLMWWRWLGWLICSSNYKYFWHHPPGEKSKPQPPKKATQTQKLTPCLKGLDSCCATHAARGDAQLFDFCEMQGVTLLWLKSFCLPLCWSKAGSLAGWGWKKAIRKFLLLSHDLMEKNNLAISLAWEENNFSQWRETGII